VLPDPARIADWRNNRTGIAALKIDGRRISSSSRNLAIDLGGYLKGYALDRAASILREQGATNALINIGGNVMALGSKNGTAVERRHSASAPAGTAGHIEVARRGSDRHVGRLSTLFRSRWASVIAICSTLARANPSCTPRR
jgi:hypothetical protein